jgi:hypothetical protein
MCPGQTFVATRVSFATGVTGQPDVRRYNTTGLASSGLFSYQSGHEWLDERPGDTGGKFLLSTLFSSLQVGGSPKPANCQDVSAFLELCFETQGSDGLLKQLLPSGISTDKFETNLICPIGGNGYGSEIWSFHQVLILGGKVFDACAKQQFDLNGQLYNDAPFEWPLADYWQKVNPSSPPPYLGLVDGPDLGPSGPVTYQALTPLLDVGSGPILLHGIE